MTEGKKVTVGQALDAIGKAMGVDAKAIFAEVDANMKKLRECKLHDFEDDAKDKTSHGVLKRQRCRNCGGTVSSTEARWYKRGWEHALAQLTTPPTAELGDG